MFKNVVFNILLAFKLASMRLKSLYGLSIFAVFKRRHVTANNHAPSSRFFYIDSKCTKICKFVKKKL